MTANRTKEESKENRINSMKNHIILLKNYLLNKLTINEKYLNKL